MPGRGQMLEMACSDRPEPERRERRCACPIPSPRKAGGCLARRPRDLVARSKERGPKGVLRVAPALRFRLSQRLPRLPEIRATAAPRSVVECVARVAAAAERAPLLVDGHYSPAIRPNRSCDGHLVTGVEFRRSLCPINQRHFNLVHAQARQVIAQILVRHRENKNQRVRCCWLWSWRR